MWVSREWLQTFFENPLPWGEELATLFTFNAFEVEDLVQKGADVVLDLDVLPNRSSDCLSHRGIAREISMLLDMPLARDPLRMPLTVSSTLEQVTVECATRTCTRYMAAVLRGVTVGPSPDWLQDRLRAIGQRPINNIVDATNYIMFELGQPLHAFDLNKLTHSEAGIRMIKVRAAHPHESITVLGGETLKLAQTHALITDGVADTPIAIAGVKGGVRAEIDEDTTDIVLEAANFHPVAIRRTARALKLATEASLRFQNELPDELAAFALRDVVTLLQEISHGVLIGIADTGIEERERMPTNVSLDTVNAYLGTTLSVEEVEQLLVRYEWEFSRNGKQFTITAPWERTDLHAVEDFIEEIGRAYGLSTIPSILPPVPPEMPAAHPTRYYEDLVRRTLIEHGCSEVYTYTLTDHGEVELANPLAADKAFLRLHLREGMQDALVRNSAHAPVLGLEDVCLFELGVRASSAGEDTALCIGHTSVRDAHKRSESIVRKLVTILETTLGTSFKGTYADGVWEGSLTKAIQSLPDPTGYGEALPWRVDTTFAPWSPYPFVLRDLAVWVPNTVSVETVAAIVREAASELLVRMDTFDRYEKEGRVSYAWHLVFQSEERTLTDDEVHTCMEAVAQALTAHEGWEVR